MGANGLDTTVRDFAIDLARRAGDILIEIRERGLRQDSIHPKLGHFDIVTEADLASEQFILSELAAAFPSYGVMSEETNQRLSDKEWVWIVDPLDGTTNFAHGLPIYAVNIGLAHGGRPVLAVTYEPTYQQTYWAMPGEGAWLRRGNSEFPLRVSPIGDLQHALLATGFQYSRHEGSYDRHAEFAHLDTITQSVRRLGSAALTMAWIAAGHLEAYWETGLKAWDFAPGWLIVEEAGGQLVEFDGSPISLDSQTLIVSNGQPVIVEAIQQTIRRVGAEAALSGALEAGH